MDNQLEVKHSYLIRDTNPDKSYELFSSKLDGEFSGMCVTRSNPLDIKSQYGLDIPILWLSNSKDREPK